MKMKFYIQIRIFQTKQFGSVGGDKAGRKSSISSNQLTNQNSFYKPDYNSISNYSKYLQNTKSGAPAVKQKVLLQSNHLIGISNTEVNYFLTVDSFI